MSKSKPPKSLAEAGKALWREHADKYTLRPDELARLEMACRARDMVARLDEAWSALGYPMVSKGSMGQEVIHPIVGELRAQQAQVDRILAGLKLPDDGVAEPANQQRSAAQSRWATGVGRGA